MKKMASYSVYFKGSKKHYNRTVYNFGNGAYRVLWYGQLIEVVRTESGSWVTVENY